MSLARLQAARVHGVDAHVRAVGLADDRPEDVLQVGRDLQARREEDEGLAARRAAPGPSRARAAGYSDQLPSICRCRPSAMRSARWPSTRAASSAPAGPSGAPRLATCRLRLSRASPRGRALASTASAGCRPRAGRSPSDVPRGRLRLGGERAVLQVRPRGGHRDRRSRASFSLVNGCTRPSPVPIVKTAACVRVSIPLSTKSRAAFSARRLSSRLMRSKTSVTRLNGARWPSAGAPAAGGSTGAVGCGDRAGGPRLDRALRLDEPERPDLAALVVLEDLQLLGLQVAHRPALLVPRDHVEEDHGRSRAELGGRLGTRLGESRHGGQRQRSDKSDGEDDRGERSESAHRDTPSSRRLGECTRHAVPRKACLSRLTRRRAAERGRSVASRRQPLSSRGAPSGPRPRGIRNRGAGSLVARSVLDCSCGTRQTHHCGWV